MEIKTKNNQNHIKEPRHHQGKISKSVSGKRTNFILDLESYKNLKDKSKEKNLTMTKFLETLLKEKGSQNALGIAKITALTNLNQKFYTDLNTTFSNLNQIAYNLNLDKFLETSRIDNVFLKNIADELIVTRIALQELRLLTLEFLLYLEIDNKKYKQIQNRIKIYQQRYKKEMAKIKEGNAEGKLTDLDFQTQEDLIMLIKQENIEKPTGD
ncbi:hypothetical protein BKH41_01880 [Helicobacter sp. 12S02232-10]|uniref:hypothetical protein n=1 Tax=Helicobacter sp. 12S02232-10 TaxID=1476197 RepID=UPI000BA7135C|nr:hypothetical protein [Helicobacter sp. 12S02232-10]PAF49439.1 hypothetical protein BKH41_01880 [Helicobacter sp. 12S02232-10]